MAALMNLDHAHAEGVFNSIDSALDLCGVPMGILNANQQSDHPVMIGANFDGASVMMGVRARLTRKLKGVFPHIMCGPYVGTRSP